MKPYERLPEAVEYDGKEYRLDASWSAFFIAADVAEDNRLTDYAKVATALDVLVDGEHPVDVGLLNAIFDLMGKAEESTEPKTMDMEQDWELIVAAFQQAYGIDLYAERKMHVMRFLALLKGIPKDTRLSEVVGIRAKPLPTPTKYNQEEIAELSRLKARYALKANGMNMQDGWQKLFQILEAKTNG